MTCGSLTGQAERGIAATQPLAAMPLFIHYLVFIVLINATRAAALIGAGLKVTVV
jgi:hypothetical protein